LAFTGNLAMLGFTAPKLAWVRAHEPECFAKVAHVLLPKDYLRLRMTGERASSSPKSPRVGAASGVDPVDLFHAHIGGLDTLAEALVAAVSLLESAELSRAVDARFQGWNAGLGRDILEGKLDLEALCDAYGKKTCAPSRSRAARSSWRTASADTSSGARSERAQVGDQVAEVVGAQGEAHGRHRAHG
jgi:hypothetical protein